MARWIKIYDGLLEWEWHKRPEMISLFVHLLLMANTKDGRYEGHEIKKGQLATSLASLSETTGLTTQTLRTCLKHLQQTGEILIKSTSRFSIISICKYDDYQVRENGGQQTANKQLTNDQQAPNKQLTTILEYKNKENIYNNPPISKDIVPPSSAKPKLSIAERRRKFAAQLEPYLEKYGADMLNKFYVYWTGMDEGDTKMAFEKVKSKSKNGTFNLPYRLATWKRNDDKDMEQQSSSRRVQKGCTILEALQATAEMDEPTSNKLLGI